MFRKAGIYTYSEAIHSWILSSFKLLICLKIVYTENSQTLFFNSVMFAKPSLFLQVFFADCVDQQEHACWIIVHSTYCGKVTLAGQFEVTEESLNGIRVSQFRTVGALKVKSSSSALILFPRPFQKIFQHHKSLQYKLFYSGGYVIVTARPRS